MLRKTLLGVACFVSMQAAMAEPERVTINFSSPDVDNRFSRNNPNYKPRAASFYERKYLPSAADYLIEVCDVNAALHPYLMEILRAFLYERIDAYVRGGGQISVTKLSDVVERMEDRLKKILTTDQWTKYPKWKGDGAGKNGFDFLLVTPPRVDRLPEKGTGEQNAAEQPASRPAVTNK
ncbi:MAG: hypothetical protein QM496_03680 [Verrucomicrobiota bacterium]